MNYQIAVKYSTIYYNNKAIRTIIGHSGGYRLVARTSCGRKIVKADYRNDDDAALVYQTKHEILMLPKIAKRDARYFPTVLSHGTYKRNKKTYHWMVQVRAKFDRTIKVTPRIARTLRRLSQKYGISDLCETFAGAKTTNNSNWGITDKGFPLLYDFGFNQKYHQSH